MKTALLLAIFAISLTLMRRPLLRLYLAIRDTFTDAPLTGPEAWVYRRLEGD